MNRKRAWLTWLGIVPILAVAFGSPFADQPVTALAPIDTILDARNELVGVAVLPDGTRYVTDRGSGIVYRVSASGTVSTAASGLSRPAGLALDASGRLLIAEEQAGRVLRLESNGSLTVLATGLKTPRWIVVNPDGSLYITAHRLTEADGPDTSEGRDIVRMSAGGTLSVVATGIRQLQGLARVDGAVIAATKGVQSGSDSAGSLLRFAVNADGSLGAPTAWISTGLKQPVGLALDALAAMYASSKELTTDTDTSKRAIGKVHPDLHLSDFASNLTDPQGLALGPDGSLYLADGKGGKLLRFRAPTPPTLTAPAFTKLSSVTVSGTTEAGARVDLFLNDAPTAVTVTAGTTGAFSTQLALTANQMNTLDVFATAQGGNGLTSAPLEATIVHDGQAPSLVFQAPPGGAYVRLSVNVEAQASDPGSSVSSLALTIDGAALASTVTPALPASSATATATWPTTSVADGTHTLGAMATDRAGNSASVSRVVTVDNTSPDTQITSGPSGTTPETSVTFTFTGSDNLTPAQDLQFAWRLDGGAFTAFSAATSASFTGLAQGPHTFEVKSRDRAGNEDPTPASRGFSVSALSVAITDPAGGATVPAGLRIVRGTVDSGGVEVAVSVNGVVAAVQGSTFAVQVPLAPDVSALTATAITTAGASATHSIGLTVSPTASPAPSLSASPRSGAAPLTVTFTISGVTSASVALDVDGNGSVDFSGPRLDGQRFTYAQPGLYFPRVTVTDAQGAQFVLTTIVHVESPAAVNARFRTLWAGFKARVTAGDTPGALGYLSPSLQGRIERVLRDLGPAAGSVVAAFGDLRVVEQTDDLAEAVVVQRPGATSFLYFIYFRRDSLGRWRIEEM